MELDPVRLQLTRLLERKDTNMRAASVAIGMNPAYLHQFIFRGTPKVLPRKIRSLLAKHLGVEEKVLNSRGCSGQNSFPLWCTRQR